MRQAPRHNPKVDLNQKEIIHALEKIGCTVEVIGKPLDLLVGFRKMNFLIECKTAKGRPTPAQEDFFKAWRGQFMVVRTVNEALDLVTHTYLKSVLP